MVLVAFIASAMSVTILLMLALFSSVLWPLWVKSKSPSWGRSATTLLPPAVSKSCKLAASISSNNNTIRQQSTGNKSYKVFRPKLAPLRF